MGMKHYHEKRKKNPLKLMLFLFLEMVLKVVKVIPKKVSSHTLSMLFESVTNCSERHLEAKVL